MARSTSAKTPPSDSKVTESRELAPAASPAAASSLAVARSSACRSLSRRPGQGGHGAGGDQQRGRLVGGEPQRLRPTSSGVVPPDPLAVGVDVEQVAAAEAGAAQRQHVEVGDQLVLGDPEGAGDIARRGRPGRSRRYVTRESIRRVWSMAFVAWPVVLPSFVRPPQPLATARSRSTTSARSSAGSSTTTSGPNSTSQASSPCPYGISNSSQPSPSSRTEAALARSG